MYVRELALRNIKCFADLKLTFPPVGKDGNWCVVLGENGTGKSTILRSIALALVSQRTASRLLNNPAGWIRQEKTHGECDVDFFTHRSPDSPFRVSYMVTGDQWATAHNELDDEPGFFFTLDPSMERRAERWRIELVTTVVAGYGPFRRPETHAPTSAGATRLEGAFLTLFNDAAGIEDLETWLQQLDYASKDTMVGSKEGRESTRNQLEDIKALINSLWPDDGKVRMDVNASGVFFIRDDNVEIPLREMSDGYRTVFALACDLLRQASKTKLTSFHTARTQTGRLILDMPGIVLIDEVDAHLHPKWQREIGFYLQRAFPRVQFIVATHSPFVAQAASEGGIIILERDPETNAVRANTSIESLRGVPAENILQSAGFGLTMTTDIITEAKLYRHAALAQKRDTGKLKKSEAAELSRLDEDLKELLPRIHEENDVMLRLEELLREAREKRD